MRAYNHRQSGYVGFIYALKCIKTTGIHRRKARILESDAVDHTEGMLEP